MQDILPLTVSWRGSKAELLDSAGDLIDRIQDLPQYAGEICDFLRVWDGDYLIIDSTLYS